MLFLRRSDVLFWYASYETFQCNFLTSCLQTLCIKSLQIQRWPICTAELTVNNNPQRIGGNIARTTWTKANTHIILSYGTRAAILDAVN